jgi:hypothetical protein
MSVVKKLGAAEKITDTASRILADATLGATAGAALASMTATPGSDSIDDGIASGAFYGTLLGTLGRAAIKRAPESTAATVDQPVTPKDLDLIVKSPEYLDLVRAETVDLIKRPADGLEVVDSVPEDAIWVNAPSTVQAMPAKSTGVEVGDSVPKNAPAMLESGRTPKALRALQPEVGLLESGRTPKALRAPVAEELPLGNTKSSAPDMTALRARVEKTQKVIDELSAKDVKEGLTDNELVTLEQAEATIARDVETLKGLEASELTSAKKPKKVLAMENPTKDAGPSRAKKNVLSEKTAHTKDTTTPKVPKKPRKILAMEKSATETSPRKAKKKVLSAAKLPKQEPTAPAPSQTGSFTVDSILKRKTRMTDTSIGDANKHIEDLDLDLLSPADAAAVKKALEALQGYTAGD